MSGVSTIPDDARACRIRLTDAGAALQRRVGLAHARQVAKAMTRSLDRDELLVLRDLCRRLLADPDRALAADANRRRLALDAPDGGSKRRPAAWRVPETPPKRLAVVSAGTSEPSSTRMLADRLAQRTSISCGRSDIRPSVERHRARRRSQSTSPARRSTVRLSDESSRPRSRSSRRPTRSSPSTPVYKAGISGLFKSFVDVLDDDLLIAKPVLLAATAGSARHALVIDEQMRPLFAYMRALTLPTSVFAAPEDWGDAELGGRIAAPRPSSPSSSRQAIEQRIADCAWSGYQHQFAGNASRAERTAADVDFDSPLMRLAAGGTTGRRSNL